MVKKQEVSIKSDFKASTDPLLVPMGLADLAKEMDCSLAAVRQARLTPGTDAFRKPPSGWEVTVRRLLEAKADHFTKLAAQLRDRQSDR